MLHKQIAQTHFFFNIQIIDDDSAQRVIEGRNFVDNGVTLKYQESSGRTKRNLILKLPFSAADLKIGLMNSSAP